MGGKYDFMYKAAKKSVVTLIKHAVNGKGNLSLLVDLLVVYSLWIGRPSFLFLGG